MTEQAVAALSLKIPPFWTADPELWFAQVEVQFECSGIKKEETKFHHVLANLPQEVAMEVRELFVNPPDNDPYQVLKKTLIKRTAASEQRRLKELLSSEDLGDRKPSQLLRRMQQLLGDKDGMDPSFLKELFLQRLPNNVRMILASAGKDRTLQELADIADSITEVVSSSIAAVATPQVSSEFAELQARITSLEKTISALQRPRQRGRSRSRSNRRFRSRSPSHHGLCWYHRRFGDAAHKCAAPCLKQGNQQASV